MSPVMATENTTAQEALVAKKVLAGAAKNYLDDLLTLDDKTRAEMVRGIREGYLDADGAIDLSGKLGIEPPRVKKKFYFYFTQTTVHSLTIDAYDEEQAKAEAERFHRINVSHNDIHYGAGSRFNQQHGRIRRVFSEVTQERPTVEALPAAVHEWDLERSQAERDGRSVSDWHRSDINFDTLITD